MDQKTYWEKLHQNDYHRFSLSERALDSLLEPYKKFLRKDMIILDVGCGDGHTTAYFRKYIGRRHLFKNCREQLYGIDISQTVIEKAKVRYPNINFKICDGKSIPFKDNFFDFIFMHSVIVHIPRSYTANYLKEFERVLKPNGLALLQFTLFPKIDDIEESPIFYPDFGPEPHIGWPLEKTLNLILNSKLTIESIIKRRHELNNPALVSMRDYWVLLRKKI